MTLRRIALVLAVATLPAVSRAQQHPPVRAEIRVDATSANVDRLELGAGAAIPMGTYVRVALLAGGGIARYDARPDGSRRTVSAVRGDVIARFQIDPFHQSARGLYGGGGVSYLASEGARGQAYVTLAAGMELRDHGPVAPAIEVALGGGLRVSVALRRSGRGWR